MNDISKFRAEILTGQFQAASAAEQQMIRGLFGNEVIRDFEIYFHWYNMIHELGHGIMFFHAPKRPHGAQEEQLVNDFAVAYWRTYGEPETFALLSEIVHHTLKRFPCPSAKGIGHIEYAKSIWGTDALMTFETYGWFQFSCVAQSLSKSRALEEVFSDMGITCTRPQNTPVLRYEIDEKMPGKIITDAVKVLKQWGIVLPEQIDIRLVQDPNCHMIKTVLL